MLIPGIPRLLAILIVPIAMLCTSRGVAEVLAEEPFAYPAGQALHNQAGGTGWGDAWFEVGTTTNYDEIAEGSLSYGALITSGNSLRSHAPFSLTTDLSRRLAAPLAGSDGTELWISFLMRKDSAGSATDNHYFGIAIYPSDENAPALFIGDTGETDFYSLGIAGSDQGQMASANESVVSTDATLLVTKITFQAGPEAIELFVNPDPTGPTPSAASATKSDLAINDVTAVGILAGFDAIWSADEIKFGRSFGDVVPAATPPPTPTPTPAPTEPPTPTPTPSATPTPTASATPSPSVSPTPSPSPSPSPTVPARPLNISTRLQVGTDEDVLIAGFIITGSESKRVIVRGIGPSLQSQLSGFLPDPLLDLRSGHSLVDTNDDWTTAQQQEIKETGVAPENEAEAALIATLAPGAYTVAVRDNAGAAGIGLVEVYDLGSGGSSTLANISTRGTVGADDQVMIGGFILGGGETPRRILLRAIGPSLADSGIANPLPDPQLELRDGQGVLVRKNDDWQQEQESEIRATGIPPSDAREAAIIDDLQPGAYTAIVSGGNGVGLVEVYALGEAE